MISPRASWQLWALLAYLVAGVREALPSQLQLTPRRSNFLAGEKVTVIIPESPLKGAEEFELLLQARGLKAELVRLTPSYLAGNRTVTFKLPNLPGIVGRLVLRAGAGGREWLVATSDEFFIVATDARDIPRLVQRGGEWWFELSPGLQPSEYLSGWDSGFPAFLPLGVGPRSPEAYTPPPVSKTNRQRASGLATAFKPTGPARRTPLSFPKRE
ncbi:MAG: hypothetical protein ACUVRY_09300 [Thermoanaerobaculaceae bacterium]